MIFLILGLSALLSLSGCSAFWKTKKKQEVLPGGWLNESDLDSELDSILLPSNNNYFDFRGVGDSGWARSSDSLVKPAEFGKAVENFNKERHLLDGDFNYLNWESVVAKSCDTPKKLNTSQSFSFISHPSNILQAFKFGFNLFGLSNNHSRDCFDSSKDGSAGEKKTTDEMHKIGRKLPLLWHGVTANGVDKNKPAVKIFKIKGKMLRVAFASLYTGRAQCPFSACLDDAADLFFNFKNTPADFKILALHSQDTQGILEDWGAKFIRDFGGDIVYGTGPHIWAPVRILAKPDGKKGVMFAGLGNFIHPGLMPQKRNGMGRALFDIKTKRLVQVQFLPLESVGSIVKYSDVSGDELEANLKWKTSGTVRGVYSNIRE